MPSLQISAKQSAENLAKLFPKREVKNAGKAYKEDNPEVIQARKSFVDFMAYEGRGQWAREPHLELLCEKLQAVSDGEITRLMVFMPPRHGKSQCVSKKFPAWHLGRHSTDSLILSSYSADLAFDFSQISRDTLIEEREIFSHIMVSKTSRAKARWTIAGEDEAGLIAAGVGGPITGRGCDIGIIDDPVKNYEEAHSETVRNSIWQWYLTTFRTRLAPGGRIILVMTRWHEDDLAGRLIERMAHDGEKWEIISLPAIAEDEDPLGRKIGEALSPRYPLYELEKIKKGDRQTWISLYQQRPRAEEGGYFRLSWCHEINLDHDNAWQAYTGGIVLSAIDFSIGEKEVNDWIAIGTGVLTTDIELILLNIRRFRVSDPDFSVYEIAEQICEVQRKYNPVVFGMEDGQILKTAWPVIRTESIKQRLSLNEMPLKPIRDKAIRARTAQAWMRQGRCYFRKDQDWYEPFEDEMLGFPNARWDDQVDMYAWLLIMAQDMAPNLEGMSR